ncbi:MAG: glycosyltransferase family 2 protein [Treponemataceae bacterium]
MGKSKLCLVVPCYNEEEAIPIFYKETCRVLDDMNLSENEAEFVFVDDGSKDKTISVIKQLAGEDTRVHYISFSRNFGKEAAIYAGLNKSSAEYTAILDADLQHPPSLLPDMLKALDEEKYDCTAAKRITRKKEPMIRSLFSKLFYKIMNKMSESNTVYGAGDFRLMSENYKNAVLSLREKNRFSKGIFPWVGFRTKYFEYENIERVAGKTKWSFSNLFVYAIDGLIGFSTKPLTFAAIMGVLSIFVAFFLVAFIIIRKLVFGDPVQGWASTVCLICFLGGLQLFSIGILGLYIAKIYTEVKDRPLYIVKEEG